MIGDWTVDSRFRFPCQWNLDSGLAGIPTFGRIPNSLKWIPNFKAQDFGFHKQTFSDLTPESDNLSCVGIKLHTSNKTSTYKSIRLAIQSKESRKFSFKGKCITRSTNVRGFIQRTRTRRHIFYRNIGMSWKFARVHCLSHPRLIAHFGKEW